jgi:hypothetical protein
MLSARRLLAFAVGAATMVTPFVSTSAYADRCEPSEPVVRVLYPTYEEPVNEADSPLCYTLLNYVYPRVCDDQSTLLGGPKGPGCVKTVNPDPYEPVVVYGYSPDAGRVACNVSGFALYIAGQPSSTC